MSLPPEIPPKPRKSGGCKLKGNDYDKKKVHYCLTDRSSEDENERCERNHYGHGRSQRQNYRDNSEYCHTSRGHDDALEEYSDTDNESVQNSRPSCSFADSSFSKDRNRSLYIDIVRNHEHDDNSSISSDCDDRYSDNDGDDNEDEDGALRLECKWVKTQKSRGIKRSKDHSDFPYGKEDLHFHCRKLDNLKPYCDDSDGTSGNDRMSRSHSRSLRAGSDSEFPPSGMRRKYYRRRELQSDSGIDYRPRRTDHGLYKKYQNIEYASIPKVHSIHRDLHRERKHKPLLHSAPQNRVAFVEPLAPPRCRRSVGHLPNYPRNLERDTHARNTRTRYKQIRDTSSLTNTQFNRGSKEQDEDYNEACILC